MPKRKKQVMDQVLRDYDYTPTGKALKSLTPAQSHVITALNQGVSLGDIVKSEILPKEELKRFLRNNFEEHWNLIKGNVAADIVVKMLEIIEEGGVGAVDAAKFLASAASDQLDPGIRREKAKASAELDANIQFKRLLDDDEWNKRTVELEGEKPK